MKVDASAVAAQGIRRALADLTGYEPAPEVIAAIEEGTNGDRPDSTVVAAVIVGSPDFQKR